MKTFGLALHFRLIGLNSHWVFRVEEIFKENTFLPLYNLPYKYMHKYINVLRSHNKIVPMIQYSTSNLLFGMF
jgi:hypothetical protein